MSEEEKEYFYQLATRYLTNEVAPEEVDQLKSLIDSDKDYEQLFNFIDASIKQYRRRYQNSTFSPSRGKSKLKAKLIKHESDFSFHPEPSRSNKLKRTKRILVFVPAIAAVVLGLLFFLPYQFKNQDNQETWITKTTVQGQKSVIKFEDGSVITLNAESTLIYPNYFNDSVRKVKLRGEAFFDIQSNPERPFIVESDEVSTHVFGTQFNVRAYEGEASIYVSLLEGTVHVKAFTEQDGKEESYILAPSQQFVFDKKKATHLVRAFDNEQVSGWKDNVLIFRRISIGKAIQTLERHYGVTFEINETTRIDCQIDAEFNNESLWTILKVFKFAANLDYEIIDERKILLKGKGCNDNG